MELKLSPLSVEELNEFVLVKEADGNSPFFPNASPARISELSSSLRREVKTRSSNQGILISSVYFTPWEEECASVDVLHSDKYYFFSRPFARWCYGAREMSLKPLRTDYNIARFLLTDYLKATHPERAIGNQRFFELAMAFCWAQECNLQVLDKDVLDFPNVFQKFNHFRTAHHQFSGRLFVEGTPYFGPGFELVWHPLFPDRWDFPSTLLIDGQSPKEHYGLGYIVPFLYRRFDVRDQQCVGEIYILHLINGDVTMKSPTVEWRLFVPDSVFEVGSLTPTIGSADPSTVVPSVSRTGPITSVSFKVEVDTYLLVEIRALYKQPVAPLPASLTASAQGMQVGGVST